MSLKSLLPPSLIFFKDPFPHTYRITYIIVSGTALTSIIRGTDPANALVRSQHELMRKNLLDTDAVKEVKITRI